MASPKPTRDTIEAIVASIRSGERPLAADEADLARLRELIPLFDSSDRMLSLERLIESRRQYSRLTADGSRFTQQRIAAMIEEVMTARVVDAEADAFIRIIEENVPHPEIFTLMFYAEPALTPTQVAEAAYEYAKPG